MSIAASTLESFRELDRLARGNSILHRLHPVIALLASMVFVVIVSSFPPREVGGLLPFLLVPVAGAAISGVSVGFLALQLLRAAPFVLTVAAPALFLDREMVLATLPLSGGVLSFLSVILRLVLTVGVSTLLVATIGVEGLCWALGRVGLPATLGVQILLLHRHLIVLCSEAARMGRARELRAFGARSGMKIWGAMVGSLFLRALSRGERVTGAMRLRGFQGELRPLRSRPLNAGDLALLIAFSALLVLFRVTSPSNALGAWFLGWLG